LTGAQPQPLIANRTPVVRRQRPGRGVSARKRSRDATVSSVQGQTYRRLLERSAPGAC
jgi:hypothetical protein